MTTGRAAKRPRSTSRTHSASSSPSLSHIEAQGRRLCLKPPSPLLQPVARQNEELPTPIALAVADHFSTLEIHFQLDEDRRRSGVLHPRDIGNLLLWAVPSAVPLVEGPRVFFIKNKSKLRDVVVIYVNGWTYEDIMSSVAVMDSSTGDSGRKRHRTEDTNRRCSPKRTKRSTQCDNHEDGTHEEHDNDPDANSGANVSSAASAVDGILLHPIRTQQCWARRANGVQCAPLLMPSGRRPLPQDIFWRSGDTHSAAAPQQQQQRPNAEPNGVGTLFGRALALHSSASNPASPTAATDPQAQPQRETQAQPQAQPEAQANAESNAEAQANAESNAEALDQQGEDAALWGDAALLTTYALTLDAHPSVMEGLGYTCATPPGDDADEWSSFDSPSAHSSDGPRVFALDCEMVLVGDRVSALARATLVDVRRGEVVLDTLVKPRLAVVDYLTQYSGIDAEMLHSVETTLRDCQRELKRYIDSDTFVVGHSLENDFKACKMVPNCRVLDTAHLFPHPGGLPFKNALRFLAMRYLRRKIQQGAHDSAVDAQTSADLVLLKLRHGPTFGVRARVSILQQIRDAGTAAAHIEMHLFDDACALRALVGDADTQRSPHTVLHAVPVRHDRDAARKAAKCLQQRHTSTAAFALTWVQLSGKNNKNNNDNNVKSENSSKNGSVDDAAQGVEETNRRVMRIVRAAPHNSLVLVLAGRDEADDSGGPAGRGVCFAYVKDEREAGPPAAWLDAEAGDGGDTHNAVADVPPACKQQ